MIGLQHIGDHQAVREEEEEYMTIKSNKGHMIIQETGHTSYEEETHLSLVAVKKASRFFSSR